MNAIAKLFQAMGANHSLACVGLDPDPRKMPESADGRNEWVRVRDFLHEVIAITAQGVCCYKAQKAFFDGLTGGHELLKETIEIVHGEYPLLPVFVDCKIGDIDNTMDAYLDNLFGKLDADGIVVNPYMGDEVIHAISKYPDRAGIVLVKTSNPGSAIVQDALMQDGRPVWEYILDLVVNRWNTSGNLIPVISSTAGLDLARIRALIPDNMPILFAGFGAQGGSPSDLNKLLNSDGMGVFVNSSRGILYPYQPHASDWRSAIQKALAGMNEQLNAQRKFR